MGPFIIWGWSMNTAMVLAVTLALNGTITTPQSGYCLRFVRQVVEFAYNMPDSAFYGLYWTHRVEENHTNEPWARDLERSLRAAGLAVVAPQAGDLVFNYRILWPYGHAGVMLSDILVVDVQPHATGPPLRVTPVWEWGPTTIIRLPLVIRWDTVK